jgi:hypothetical protein
MNLPRVIVLQPFLGEEGHWPNHSGPIALREYCRKGIFQAFNIEDP